MMRARILPLLLVLGCGTSAPPAPRDVSPKAPVATPPSVTPAPAPAPRPALVAEAEAAAQRGADYIAAKTRRDGKLVYLINLDPEADVPRKYNVLRHAGALYALGQVHSQWPSPERAAALGRSLRYFQDRYLRPVADTGDQYAVWSHGEDDEAKLGGAGLALVALTQHRPPHGEPEALEGLVRFIARLQKDDGSFYSKFYAGRGPDDSWTSLYYPGEAALGLLRLHATAPKIAVGAVETATRALMFLAESRKEAKRIPPDHWALIATADRLALGGLSPGDEAALLRHAGQVIDVMLTQPDFASGAPQRGSFRADGRTTPTATRLEGILAMRPHLEDASRIAAVDAAVPPAIRFLLRAQVRTGPHRGAVPKALREDADPRHTEVRIDYVQHAVSAWLAYAALETPPE